MIDIFTRNLETHLLHGLQQQLHPTGNVVVCEQSIRLDFLVVEVDVVYQSHLLVGERVRRRTHARAHH